MTLGTNTTLEERIIYAPDEVDTDEILEALRELAEWRLLGDTPGDVKEQIEDLEKEASEKEKEVETLEERNVKLSDEVENLKDRVLDLEEEIRNLGDA
jgi:predicted RNase H-like nuclease (RuvC/YqgF family)